MAATYRNRRPLISINVFVLALSGAISSAHAQGIPKSEYFRYVPLDYPRLTRQTPTSAHFRLFGDTTSPEYRDTSPVDGIDDQRFQTLQALALRFAPFMIQNTFSVPMDIHKLMRRQPSFPMFVHTWELAGHERLVKEETVDFNALGEEDCPYSGADRASPDCQVLELLEEFDPASPTNPRSHTVALDLDSDPVKVLFFDMPGHDPATWKAEYANPVTGQLRVEFHDAMRVYVHPFLDEIVDASGRHHGYDMILQYWFYYPLNDGGNNHEGDWEHINVVIGLRGRVAEPLSEVDVTALLESKAADSTVDDELVIKRVEYYFHHKLMTLDYSRPNAYAPRDEWDREWRSMVRERIGQADIWMWIRRLAYRGPDEQIVNTHPVAYIGADNKGIDQLMSSPGGQNQDSHGTFPFPGLYKTVGPAGSAEQIPHTFDHWKWYADETSRAPSRTDYGPGYATLFDDATRLAIVPDWERVLPLVRTNRDARREWAWLVLPVRWGYPASSSPLAGLVSHADMGNVGPIGPAYNDGWNRSGTGRGYEDYSPNILPSFFPVEPQDGFSNKLGYFNLLPLIGNLPPFDFLWRVVALPFRGLFKRQDPIFYPAESVPARFIGPVGGMGYTTIPTNAWNALAHLTENNSLVINGDTVPRVALEIAADILALDSLGGGNLKEQGMGQAAWGSQGQVAFYIGKRFMSATGFRHAIHTVGFEQPLTTGAVYEFTAALNWWDITGTIRYDVLTGGFKPFFALGYGINWYRLENMTSDGELLPDPTADWITNIWPPTWQYGLGGELMLAQSFARIPRGIDAGIRAEILWLNGPSGINLPNIFTIATFREVPRRFVRRAVNLSLSLSF